MRTPFGGSRREPPRPGPIPEQPTAVLPHQTPLFAQLHLNRMSTVHPFDLLPEALVQVSADSVPEGDLVTTRVGPAAAHVSVRAARLGTHGRLGIVGPGDAALLCGAEDGRLVVRTGRSQASPILAEAPLPTGAVTLTLTDATVTVWDDNRPVAQARVPVDLFGDLRRADVVATLSYAWCGVDDASAGGFGYVGVRDPHLVEDEFGAPVLRDGRVLVTFTCAGPDGTPTAHWGLFSTDPAQPLDLRLEAAIWFAHDGLVVGDHAGQLIVDDHDAEALVSTWSTFDLAANPHVAIRRARLPQAPGPGIHVIPSEPVEVPTEVPCWDPCFTRYSGYLYLGFTECWRFAPEFEFRPVLARRRADDPGAPFQRVGADTMHLQTEGTLFVRDRGQPLLLASDGDARDYPVYRLDMTRIGRVEAPYGSGIPHPCLVRLPGRAAFMLTCDDTPWDPSLPQGSHGALVVYSP